jgi:hypothetical protein
MPEYALVARHAASEILLIEHKYRPGQEDDLAGDGAFATGHGFQSINLIYVLTHNISNNL